MTPNEFPTFANMQELTTFAEETCLQAMDNATEPFWKIFSIKDRTRLVQRRLVWQQKERQRMEIEHQARIRERAFQASQEGRRRPSEGQDVV